MMLRLLGDLVAPLHCAACDERRADLFCAACSDTVEVSSSPAAALVYGGAVAQAIARMKYGGRSDLCRRLGAIMAHAPLVERLVGLVDVVVSVPMHRLRLIERGYDHAALLARPIARKLGVPLEVRALERTRDTPRQASLDRAHRLVNVARAFAARQDLEGRRVVLVDDVRTTGATLAECMSALAVGGAARVVPFVLASRDHELHGNS